ncbi:MAG: O-antigen ligase family protein [Anaerolineales bacterium]
MRISLDRLLAKLSRVLFFATIVLIPFRFRVVLLERPVGSVWEDYTNFLLFASDITLILMLVSWVGLWLVRRHPIERGPLFLTLPLAGLTLAALATSFTSIDPALSIYHSFRLVLLFGFYLYVVNEVGSIKQLFAPLGIMIAVQGFVAIAQSLNQRSIGFQWLGEYQLDPAWSGVSVVATETERVLRSYGLSDHPNILGGCLVFALLIFVVALLRTKDEWRLMPASGVLIVGTVAVLLTFSRSAWLAGVAGLAYLAFHLSKNKDGAINRRAIALGATVVLVLIPFLLANSASLGVRVGANASFEELTAEASSLRERGILIGAANTIFSTHALTGVGIGASPQAFRQQFPVFGSFYQPPHVVLLAAALETGLIGALFYAILFAAPWLALRLNRKIKMNLDLLAASALLLALTTVGFFDYYPWLLAPGRLWQYLAWGLWARFYLAATKVSSA